MIGQLYASESGQPLAEILTDVEADDLVRMRMVGALRGVLGEA